MMGFRKTNKNFIQKNCFFKKKTITVWNAEVFHQGKWVKNLKLGAGWQFTVKTRPTLWIRVIWLASQHNSLIINLKYFPFFLLFSEILPKALYVNFWAQNVKFYLPQSFSRIWDLSWTTKYVSRNTSQSNKMP